MKILVCISKVPDTTSKISFDDAGKEFNSDGIQYILNPYDEWYGLVKAVELVEEHGGEVILIHVGKNTSDPIIRKGLALGAHSAVRIDTEAVNAQEVAFQIADYIKTSGQNFDLIIGGKESISFNNGVVLGMLSDKLDMPYISNASSMNFQNNTFKVERDVRGGTEVIAINSSLIVSALKGMSEQKTPNMRGILSAKTKKIEVIQPKKYTSHVQLEKYETPPEKKGCKIVESASELVDILVNDAKVLKL